MYSRYYQKYLYIPIFLLLLLSIINLIMIIPTIDRDQLTKIYGVSQGYLGYLLRERKVPLPVQLHGQILWYADEVDASLPKIKSLLERRKKIN